jgi:GntR family transcriptional regulator
MIDKSNGIPVYKQLETLLWTEINRGILPPGTKLPSEEELAQQYGISRGTIRQTLSELANKGIITRIHGAGTFVCEPKKEFRIEDDHFISFLEGMESYGVPVETCVVDVEIVKATGSLAETFSQNLPMLRIHRRRESEGRTVMLLYDYIPMDLFLDVEKRYAGEQCIYDFLERTYATQVSKVKRIFQAIPASKNVAKQLAIKEGTPIFHVIQQALDSFGRCIDYANLFILGEGMQFSFISNR